MNFSNVLLNVVYVYKVTVKCYVLHICHTHPFPSYSVPTISAVYKLQGSIVVNVRLWCRQCYCPLVMTKKFFYYLPHAKVEHYIAIYLSENDLLHGGIISVHISSIYIGIHWMVLRMSLIRKKFVISQTHSCVVEQLASPSARIGKNTQKHICVFASITKFFPI